MEVDIREKENRLNKMNIEFTKTNKRIEQLLMQQGGLRSEVERLEIVKHNAEKLKELTINGIN